MNKITALFSSILMVAIITSCKKDEEPAVIPKVTFEKDIKAILVTRCTPCHLAGGVNANKWDNFATASAKVATVLDRIQRLPGAAGFMPRNGTSPIPSDEIAKIKQWVTDGTLEK